jgi:hypothetical protein
MKVQRELHDALRKNWHMSYKCGANLRKLGKVADQIWSAVFALVAVISYIVEI